MDEIQRGAPAGDWLGGASAVAVLTFEVEADDAGGDLTSLSHEAYGVRVGLPRALQLLTRLQVPATFFFSGEEARRYPHLLESIAMAGHELALQTPPQTIAADVEAFRALGHEVRGYRAPDWRLTSDALDRLGAAGLSYDSTLMDDDRPYRMRTAHGVLAELPVHRALADRDELEPPSRVLERWTEELSAMRGTGSLAVLACHPVVAGRPSRLALLERLVEFARGQGGIRFERADRVAEAVIRPR